MSIGTVAWFTGLSGAGKTTLAQAVQLALFRDDISAEILDGDWVRESLCKDLGFSPGDRAENLRRISREAYRLTREGKNVLVAAISPEAAVRDEIRRQHPNFIEVFVNAPLEVCERRDVKGLYRRARAGQILNFTGISAPYDVPSDPEVECRTDRESLRTSCAKVLGALAALQTRETRSQPYALTLISSPYTL